MAMFNLITDWNDDKEDDASWAAIYNKENKEDELSKLRKIVLKQAKEIKSLKSQLDSMLNKKKRKL